MFSIDRIDISWGVYSIFNSILFDKFYSNVTYGF